MNITREQYDRAVEELTRLRNAKKELGIQLFAINNTSLPKEERKRQRANLQQKIDILQSRYDEIEPIRLGYQGKRIRREKSDQRPPIASNAKTTGGAIACAIAIIRHFVNEYRDGQWSDEDARIVDDLDAAIRFGGFIATTELHEKVFADKEAELQSQIARQLNEIEILKERVVTQAQREGKARSILRTLWDARYDEIDSFRTARGVRYRVHIDDETAAAIREVL
jgi:hypothetical protein